MERSGRAKWAGRPKARARGIEERESRWTGLTTRGPGWDPLVGDTVHRAERARGARARQGLGRGARARFAEDADAAGPRAASRLAVEHAHGEGLTGVDDDAGQNGRRTTAASGGANHGDTGESEHTGWLHETRGDEPTARIRRRELDGGELRRRQPAAGEGGNGDERWIRRKRFEGGRRREALPSSGGDGGEHTASDGNGRSKERAGARRSRPKRRQGGGRRMTPAGGKGEKRERKGGLSPCLFGKRRRERERCGRGRRSSASVPWRLVRGVAGPGDDDGDDGGGGVERSGDTGDRRGQARQRLTAAATRRSATTARARGLQREVRRFERGRAAARQGGDHAGARTRTTARGKRQRGSGEGGLGSARLTRTRAACGQSGEEGERERERERRGGRGRWAERDSAHRTRGRQNRLLWRNLIWKDLDSGLNSTIDRGLEILRWHGH
uniref:Epstein-Barr virus EBNA-1-like protein n=1 Tax=Oryza sativa subsp. japonica TaxID=39947 RepID=Q5F1Y7_ORYSJ|nr:Epstein-Barr virus EBNA-1-like protein [Oryza sativa Japonica Group]